MSTLRFAVDALVLALPVVLITVVAIRLLPMFRANTKRCDEILDGESIATYYRPMERLLRESEWQFLASQPGFDAGKIRAIKAQRRKLFRGYLNCLSVDCASASLLMRGLIIQSPVARPDLMKAVSRFRTRYARSLISLELRLAAHALGITSVSIDVSGLVRGMDELGAQIRGFSLEIAQPTFA